MRPSEPLGHNSGRLSDPWQVHVVTAGSPVSNWRAETLILLLLNGLRSLRQNADSVSMVSDSMGTGRVLCGNLLKNSCRLLRRTARTCSCRLNVASLLEAGNLLQTSRQDALRQADPLVSRLTGQFWQCRTFVPLLTQATVEA